MSLREYESYVLHDRTASNSLILRGGRLTQQYCVDQWAKCEQERLRFIEKNQLQYRLETLQGLTDALRNESVDVHRVAANEEVAQRGSTAARRQSRDTGVDSAEPEAENIGRKIIIPPTFTGGPRYMYQRFLDAMAIVRDTGAPNLFITMTCNPNWPEIKENLRPGEKASDRPDIVARVFMQKLKTLNKDLDEGLLGILPGFTWWSTKNVVYLTPIYLLIMRPEDKPVTAEDVDRLTSAELPDKETHPELYETAISNMLHGPCGQQNPNCPCMKNGKCSKKFPKQFAEETIMAEDKYPTYRRRRRPEGILSHKGKVWDNAKINQWVVPYNPFLSQKYDCHINVEVCATNKAVKYIYKYVYKGSDMTTITIEGEEIQANEILQYLLGRYISPVEACMRLFGFPTQGSSHAVVNLPIHLEGMMNGVVYDTFHDAALAAGYLENDQEWEECLAEAVSFKMPSALRQLLGIILVYSLPDMLLLSYEPDDLERTATLGDQMNENQKDIFDQVIEAVNHPVGGQKLFFVDGPGGTGKSFLLEQILAHVRLQRKVAIAVASSGIAATLLTGGHTAHSTFRIPLKLSEFSTCSLSWQSQKAELIRKASLIIWDEAPIMHRACSEAVDRSFRDIMKNELEPFGGKVMVFSGDHRQILPVLKDATRAETLEACFKSSPLLRHLRQARLTENMRVQTAPDPASAAELAEFSDFLLQIGEGRYPVNSDISENDICLPRDMCIVLGARADDRWDDEETKENEDMEAPPNFNLLPPTETPPDRNAKAQCQCAYVYPGVGDDNLPDEYFVERANLAPTNASVRRINDMVSERLSGETKEYLSVDSLEGVADPNMFEQEFLNSLNFSGIPPHRI
ncbi:LOW QUALITY PROTEIN: Helitron helicase-like protein, partial [Phytophthora palmivora]